MRTLWIVVAMAWIGAMPALACLNDTRTERTEADFRGRYGEGATDEVGGWTVWGMDARGMAVMVVGAGLVAGVTVSGANKRDKTGRGTDV